MANARGPSVFVRYAGTTRSPCAAERRWRRRGSLETDPIMSIKYECASPCRHLCTKAHVLNRILWCTGSQWSSSRMAYSQNHTCSRVKNGLQWSEKNRSGKDSEHCCSSRFDSEWMRAPASLQHPSSTDGEPTRAAEADRSNFWTAVVCARQMSAHHPAPHPSN